MKNGLNWETTEVIQNLYLNRKPSEKNTYTVTARYAGFTYDELIKELESKKGVIEGKQRLVSYTPPVEY